MKIEFRRIRDVFTLDLSYRDNSFLRGNEFVNLKGQITRVDSRLFKLVCDFELGLDLVCCISGDDFFKIFNDELVLYFYDGLCKDENLNVNILDIMEFPDGYVELDFVVESEVQIIRSDFNVKENLDGSS